MRVLVLSADSFEVLNEQTGELIKGSTIFYINKYRDNSGQSLGLKPTKISGSTELFKKILTADVALPAVADLEIGTKPGAANKASLVLFDIDLIEHQPIFAK